MPSEAAASGGAAPLPCEGKSKYPTRKRAAHAASTLRSRIFERTGSKEPIRPYHCKHCSEWHIGHPPGWRKSNNQPRTGWEACETTKRLKQFSRQKVAA